MSDHEVMALVLFGCFVVGALPSYLILRWFERR